MCIPQFVLATILALDRLVQDQLSLESVRKPETGVVPGFKIETAGFAPKPVRLIRLPVLEQILSRF